MPTISAPENEPHRLRQVAESFGVDAGRYDRTRPSYPDAMIDRVVAAAPGRSLLDVGCGTGIEARQFQAAGCEVLGVEPDARMAGFARRGGLAVEVSTFEAWDPAGRTFDAVVSGTAWHWVDPVAGAAKAARVLRPGGLLVAFWNVFDLPPEVGETLAAVYRRVLPDAPIAFQPRQPTTDLYQGLFAKAVDGIRQADGFGEPERWRFDWERFYTREEWLDQLPTSGALTNVPPEKLALILEEAGAAAGDGFTMRYATVAVAATRTA